jgi:adenine specific DNA methylase Mod
MEDCIEIDRVKFPAVKVQEIFSEEADNFQSTAGKIYNLRTLLKNTSAAPSAQAEG